LIRDNSVTPLAKIRIAFAAASAYLAGAADGDGVWPDDNNPGRLAVGLDQFDFDGVGQVDLAVSEDGRGVLG
jgi:hypothetical protein